MRRRSRVSIQAAEMKGRIMSYTITHKNKKITLPAFTDLPVGVIRKARKLEADEQIWFVLETVLTEKDIATLDSMSVTEFANAIGGWTGGTPVGESLQSAKS